MVVQYGAARRHVPHEAQKVAELLKPWKKNIKSQHILKYTPPAYWLKSLKRSIHRAPSEPVHQKESNGSRTKHRPVKPCENPGQWSPRRAGVTSGAPLPGRYHPVKWLPTRDCHSDQLDLLWLKRRQRSTFYTLRTCSLEPLGSIPFPSFSEEQKESTGSTHKPALL